MFVVRWRPRLLLSLAVVCCLRCSPRATAAPVDWPADKATTSADLAAEAREASEQIERILSEQTKRAAELNALLEKQARRLARLRQEHASEDARSTVDFSAGVCASSSTGHADDATACAAAESDAPMSSQLNAPGTDVVPVSTTDQPYMRYSVARGGDAFADHFRLAGAVQLDGEVTATTPLPHDTPKGMPRYVALADALGALYVFHVADGALAARIDASYSGDDTSIKTSGTGAHVTALHAYLKRRNETMIIAGRSDGSLAVLRAVESGVVRSRSARGGQPAVSHREDRPQLALSHATVLHGGDGVRCRPRGGGGDGDEDTLPASLGAVIVIDAVKQPNGMRLLAAMDARGTAALFDEASGRLQPYSIVRAAVPTVGLKLTLGGSMLLMIARDGRALVAEVARPPSRLPVQARAAMLKELPLCVTPSAAECRGTNGSSIATVAFEMHAVSRINAVTDEGDLLWFSVAISQRPKQTAPKRAKKASTADGQSDGTSQVAAARLDVDGGPDVRCHVRARRIGTAHAGASTLVTLKGYLLSWGSLGAAVLNVTLASQKLTPDLALASPAADVAAMFGGDPATQGTVVAASNRNRFLLLSFTDGVVAWFRSDLPLHRPPDFNTKTWSQPLFLVAMVLVGVYQFTRRGGGAFGGSGFGGGMGGGSMGGMGSAMGGMEDIDMAMRSMAGGSMPGRMGGGPGYR